jgi:hypothetical protein
MIGVACDARGIAGMNPLRLVQFNGSTVKSSDTSPLDRFSTTIVRAGRKSGTCLCAMQIRGNSLPLNAQSSRAIRASSHLNLNPGVPELLHLLGVGAVVRHQGSTAKPTGPRRGRARRPSLDESASTYTEFPRRARSSLRRVWAWSASQMPSSAVTASAEEHAVKAALHGSSGNPFPHEP